MHEVTPHCEETSFVKKSCQPLEVSNWVDGEDVYSNFTVGRPDVDVYVDIEQSLNYLIEIGPNTLAA